MKQEDLCPGKARLVITATDEPMLQGFQGFETSRPSVPVKRVRLKCELCGRKVLSSVQVDHDGGEIYHAIPPHKPKMWWKKRSGRENRD